MKVGVVGAGAVGAACFLSMVLRSSAREIVLVNRNRKRAEGVVTDMRYGAVLSPGVELAAGDYSDLAGCELVMITAGVNEKSGGATNRADPKGRLRMLQSNAEVYQQIVPDIRQAAPDCIILVVTDPPDPLADVVRMLGHERVLSTGTYLDSSRFRYHLAKRLRVEAASVDAFVLGEHGTSEVFVWSSARVGGAPVTRLLTAAGGQVESVRQEIEQEVRYANITIIEGIGASQYGIGIVCARIAEAILRNERVVIPIGRYQEQYDVTLSLPSVVGRNGVEHVIQPELSSGEREALSRSGNAIRDALSSVDLGARAA